MSRKKISTTIYVTPEQSDRLRLLHERTKVPVAVYIREGIDLVLRQYEHLLPGQLPLASHADDAVDSQPPPAPRSSHALEASGRASAEPKADRAASASKG
jgi:predicted DNA-binding protein